jgi:hypothetical protein
MGHSYYSYQGHCPFARLGRERACDWTKSQVASIHSIAGKRSSRKLISTILHGWRERGYRSSSKALWGRTSTTNILVGPNKNAGSWRLPLM